jgi:hypothetical protein
MGLGMVQGSPLEMSWDDVYWKEIEMQLPMELK